MATEDKNEDSLQEPPAPAGPAAEEEGQDQGRQDPDRVRSRVKDGDQAGTAGILPTKAAEDDPRRWGDSDDDHDAWLKEQKPPHWG